MNTASRIRAYCLILLRRRAEWPYLKYPAQPRKNTFTSCATASGGSRSLRRPVSSLIRSRACCIALSQGTDRISRDAPD
jgi:hypothetical protein